jgi:hypothetical protein
MATIKCFIAGYRCAFAQLAQQIFAGFFDKAQYRTKTFFTAVFGIMALAGALLVAINRFDGGINVDANLSILYIA